MDEVEIIIVVFLFAGVVFLFFRTRRHNQATPTLAPPSAAVPLAGAANDAEVQQVILPLLAEGNTIEAIKRVRELTGKGLKDAKDYVDAVQRGEHV